VIEPLVLGQSSLAFEFRVAQVTRKRLVLAVGELMDFEVVVGFEALSTSFTHELSCHMHFLLVLLQSELVGKLLMALIAFHLSLILVGKFVVCVQQAEGLESRLFIALVADEGRVIAAAMIVEGDFAFKLQNWSAQVAKAGG
jgi:hypothetical protein